VAHPSFAQSAEQFSGDLALADELLMKASSITEPAINGRRLVSSAVRGISTSTNLHGTLNFSFRL
jgi:hypothetical protein